MIKKYHILYVENDPGSRKVMEMLITRAGFPVELTVFEDSGNLISRIESLPSMPDVFVLDIHVLPLDGFEMLTLLRNHEQFASKMIVALTASVMNAEVNQLKEAGFDGVLAKPLNFHTFPDVLTRIVNGEQIWAVHR